MSVSWCWCAPAEHAISASVFVLRYWLLVTQEKSEDLLVLREGRGRRGQELHFRCQYLYFCPGKASKLMKGLKKKHLSHMLQVAYCLFKRMFVRRP